MRYTQLKIESQPKKHESRFASNDKDDLVWTRWILWLIKCHLLFFDYASSRFSRAFWVFFFSTSFLFRHETSKRQEYLFMSRFDVCFYLLLSAILNGNKSYNAEINMYQLFRIGSIGIANRIPFLFFLLLGFFKVDLPTPSKPVSQATIRKEKKKDRICFGLRQKCFTL